MFKLVQVLCIAFILVSCTAKKSAVSISDATSKTSQNEVITKHYANLSEFKSVNIRSSVNFKDKKLNQNANAEIRIEKNKQILIVVRYLGITFVKALLTPDKVSYYDNLNSEYFEGDYQLISNWLGLDLDFIKVQNIFLGKSIYDLNSQNFDVTLENGQHKINFKTPDGVIAESLFEDSKFLLLKTKLNQPSENRNVAIIYENYTDNSGIYLPSVLNILAEQNDQISINIKYNTISFSDQISFKYEIPTGFKKITIDQE